MAALWQTSIATAEELDTPLVVVHRDILRKNIADMADFAKKHGVLLRPHLKTHKTLEIARQQLEHGAVGLTCAKLGEAEVFLEAGFTDLLIAFPLVGQAKQRRLFDLIAHFPHAKIATLADSRELAGELSAQAAQRGVILPVWVKVDSGLRRVGVLPGAPAVELAQQVESLPGLQYEGLLTHAGHSYGASSPEQVREIGLQEAECLLDSARKLPAGAGGVSVGSTPTVRVSGAVPGVTEIRPGNYVFCDATQVRLGVTTPERCALRVFARIVSRPAPDRLVIDAGAKTLALDKGAHGTDAVAGYGLIVGYEDAVIERLSEEHGVIRIPAASPLQAGDLLEIIPNHSCPVANLTDELFVLDDRGRTETWQVAARGKTR
ncbi:MAG: alanine racemase [Tumebacillaceae bacterium]